jgi:hypothetical protein
MLEKRGSEMVKKGEKGPQLKIGERSVRYGLTARAGKERPHIYL